MTWRARAQVTMGTGGDEGKDGMVLWHRMVSSSGGALVTSLLVTPLDVIKTRLQVRMPFPPRFPWLLRSRMCAALAFLPSRALRPKIPPSHAHHVPVPRARAPPAY